MSTAGQIMTRDVTAIRETVPARRAVQLLEELDVRHLPVINGAHEVVGIVSDRDLAPIASDRARLAQPVSRLMSADVLTVGLETDVDDVIDLLTEHRIGAVPVVDGDGRLAGVVSYVDVLREVAKEHRAAKA
ncbi:MAG: CBS domain-containing protein [Myxococcota bacterium]|jgi:acetoin utilization protein AcuB